MNTHVMPVNDGKDLLDLPLSWGHELIRTQDIDPVYDMLVGANLPQDQLMRWLLVYWCLYHVGAASYISELQGDAFWGRLQQAAENQIGPAICPGRWPRSAERRHWRGKTAMHSASYLRRTYSRPEDAVLYLTEVPQPADSDAVSERIQGWPAFGPWIGFKAADMLERVLGVPVFFPIGVAFYETPKAGLDLALQDNSKYHAYPGGAYHGFIHEMIRSYVDLTPPGLHNRPVNIQEVETVLCKWKSARGGHYYIGKDTHEIGKALVGWGDTARHLLTYVPQH